jgi:hypothetical protein
MSIRAMIGAAALTRCFLVEIATAQAKSHVSGQNIAAVSGVVGGSVVSGAMIQKQAIVFNRAGSTTTTRRCSLVCKATRIGSIRL